METTELHKKRGYRTSDLSPNFWKALGLRPPSAHGAIRMVVIPVITKKCSEVDELDDPQAHKCLVDKAGRHSNALMRVQITAHDTGEWSASKAKDLLINETALALSRRLKFGKDNPPPITKWEDASWHYKWSINKHHGTLSCTWLAVTMLADNAEVWFHKAGKQVWAQLPEAMEELVKHRREGEMDHLPNDFYSQLMGLPLGSMESTPPKPAMKKNRRGSVEDTITSNPPFQPQRVEGSLFADKRDTAKDGNIGGEEDPTRDRTNEMNDRA